MPVVFYMSLLVLLVQVGAVLMLFFQSFMPIGMWFLLCCIGILAGMFCYTAILANPHSRIQKHLKVSTSGYKLLWDVGIRTKSSEPTRSRWKSNSTSVFMPTFPFALPRRFFKPNSILLFLLRGPSKKRLYVYRYTKYNTIAIECVGIDYSI